ncbi:Uncharacterised protein [Porphyromonas macacae]|uniref:Uncharacterized protein n=1 Tax=Porphyromonas macacae TaxID=28115 RepID=A0A379E849_9PORP|nr:hypothetical protein [Porphyromonas macacae]SUB88522.1 Uncharacterised protein [Porphyromonas macacae]
MDTVYKEMDGKLVPIERFNLGRAKASVAYFRGQGKTEGNEFAVRRHPVVQSIPLEKALLDDDVKVKLQEKHLLKEEVKFQKNISLGRGTVINREIIKLLVESESDYPVVENVSAIDPNSTFKNKKGDKILVFPEVKIQPYGGKELFYYEKVKNIESRESVQEAEREQLKYTGRITLEYELIDRAAQNQTSIPIRLSEVVLNLKSGKGKICISGQIDEAKKMLTFLVKDDAVEIAFRNLGSDFPENHCSVSLFFEFKGYEPVSNSILVSGNRELLAGVFLKPQNERLVRLTKANLLREIAVPKSEIHFQRREGILRKNPQRRAIRGEFIGSKIFSEGEMQKSSFILKVENTINYPWSWKKEDTLYRDIEGGITSNPFNLNEKFSEFEQLYCPGISFHDVTIYKSKIQPDLFLLFPKRYLLARDSDTSLPCMTLMAHLSEGESGNCEEISKICFSYALSPDLSDLKLCELKMKLYQNKLLDDDSPGYLERIRFWYPSDINADLEVTGNQNILPESILEDGRHFVVSYVTESLSDASLFITALNNEISQYANITFSHREIRNTAIMELNMGKTIGSFVDIVPDDEKKTVTITNNSLSPCRISNVLLVSKEEKPYYNPVYFSNKSNLKSKEKRELPIQDLTSGTEYLNPKYIHLDYESLEDISKEFKQEIATTSNYQRSVIINFSKIANKKICRLWGALKIEATGNSFTFEREKSEFSTPLLLSFIIKNEKANNNYLISYEITYYDQNGNVLKNQKETFDYSKSGRIDLQC